MGSYIALVASSMIGTLVLLSFMRFTNDVNVSNYQDILEEINYEQLVSLVEIIEADFALAGFQVNDPRTAPIVVARSSEFAFLRDEDGDGNLETVRYRLGDKNSADMTENPNDRMLFRSINNGKEEPISAGLTTFYLSYLDGQGHGTSNLSKIRMLKVFVTVESTSPLDGRYARLPWATRISPKNLLNY